jgi:hypothetical protein
MLSQLGFEPRTLPPKRNALPNELLHIKQKRKALALLFVSPGDSAGIRTQDPILKRDVLYRLSY